MNSPTDNLLRNGIKKSIIIIFCPIQGCWVSLFVVVSKIKEEEKLSHTNLICGGRNLFRLSSTAFHL